MDPATMFKESLTSRPELENSQGQKPKSVRLNGRSVAPPGADIRQFGRHDRKVPQRDSCTAANGIAIRINVNSRLDRDLYSIEPAPCPHYVALSA
jgi:hypothetical protein